MGLLIRISDACFTGTYEKLNFILPFLWKLVIVRRGGKIMMRLISNLIFTKFSFCHSSLQCNFWARWKFNLKTKIHQKESGSISDNICISFIFHSKRAKKCHFRYKAISLYIRIHIWAPCLEVFMMQHAISRRVMLFD